MTQATRASNAWRGAMPATCQLKFAQKGRERGHGPCTINDCRRLVGGRRDGHAGRSLVYKPARVTRGGMNAGDLSAAEGTGTALVRSTNAGDLSAAEGTGTYGNVPCVQTRASNAWWDECRRLVGGRRDGNVPERPLYNQRMPATCRRQKGRERLFFSHFSHLRPFGRLGPRNVPYRESSPCMRRCERIDSRHLWG